MPNEKLAKVLPRYEPVLWLYDGLNGKVIRWTLQQGNTNSDPSILVFVVGGDGKVVDSMMGGRQYQAGALAAWADGQADAYERLHPTTRMPFVRTQVVLTGEGTDAKATCAEFDAARVGTKPVLVYFGRGHFAPEDKRAKKENKQARAFEKGTLDSKTAAKEAEGWVLLRVDLADEAHAAFAKTWGVESAPALLLFAPGAERPEALDRRITGASLAVLLKKHRPVSGE